MTLLSRIKQAGYGDHKQQRKSVQEVFTRGTEFAKKENSINRSAKVMQKTFTRMKQEYSAYIAKISQSAHGEDDKDLYEEPEFFKEMHDLEY